MLAAEGAKALGPSHLEILRAVGHQYRGLPYRPQPNLLLRASARAEGGPRRNAAGTSITGASPTPSIPHCTCAAPAARRVAANRKSDHSRPLVPHHPSPGCRRQADAAGVGGLFCRSGSESGQKAQSATAETL
ncbi:hypothetical protein CMUS01_16387, partial [Colletotrichum musicola]